jgi:cytochrome c553
MILSIHSKVARIGSTGVILAWLMGMVILICITAFAQSSGSATYIPYCAGCHGTNGVVVSALVKNMGAMDADAPYIKNLTARQMFSSVKNGKERMPSFKKRLTDAQIRDALAFYRELGTALSAPIPQAQGSDQFIPSESSAFVAAYSQRDPSAKAAALEGFLQTYPQSANKKTALNILMNTYSSSLNDDQNALSAAKRGLQVDPNDKDFIFVAVEIEIKECNRTGDAQICNDAAALGQRGLTIAQPPEYTDDNWRKTIAIEYPYYRKAIALARPAAAAPEPAPEAAATPPQRQYDNLAPPPTPPAPAPTITIGERKAQVLSDFGEPQRKAVVGPKEFFFYTDLKMKVTFVNGKVSSID